MRLIVLAALSLIVAVPVSAGARDRTRIDVLVGSGDAEVPSVETRAERERAVVARPLENARATLVVGGKEIHRRTSAEGRAIFALKGLAPDASLALRVESEGHGRFEQSGLTVSSAFVVLLPLAPLSNSAPRKASP